MLVVIGYSFFFKQKTAYEKRISDWSSDVCSSDLELRHLRYFLAVAEELRFARAAEKLHIEQSPLSRAIKELEEELGVVLFARTTRSTRLTHAGALFLEHVRRVFAALEQASDSVQAAANGFPGQ